MLRPLALLAALATPVGADTFDVALDDWLAGNDMAALETLGALARDGDVDAQLFLGRIATQSVHWPAAVQNLSRKDRTALLRAPGGLSGQSWVAVAAETDARAAAFDGLARPEARNAALLDLMDMGEVDAVSQAFPGYMATGAWAGALAIATHPNAPETMARTAPALALAVAGDLRFSIPSMSRTDLPFGEAVEAPDRMIAEGARIADDPDTQAFVAFCDAACGADGIPACMGAIFTSSTTDPTDLATSPVASLLAPETYRASPRAPADAARAVAVTQFLMDQSAAPPVARLSACAWEGVEAVGVR